MRKDYSVSIRKQIVIVLYNPNATCLANSKIIFWQQELAIMNIFLRPCQAKIFLVSKAAEFF